MEQYKLKDIVWLVSCRGVVIPVIHEEDGIKNIVKNSYFVNLKDKGFIYNCIIKDLFSEDRVKTVLTFNQIISLPVSKTLHGRILKEYDDVKEWKGLTNKKQILQEVYNDLIVTDKQVKLIRNEIQKYLVKQTKLSKDNQK